MGEACESAHSPHDDIEMRLSVQAYSADAFLGGIHISDASRLFSRHHGHSFDLPRYYILTMRGRPSPMVDLRKQSVASAIQMSACRSHSRP